MFFLSVTQKRQTPTVSSHNTALTALFGGSAIAADLRRPAYTPPPPVSNWTGFYIGGNLGGAWARGSVNDSLFGLSASSDRSGFIGDGQLGVNYQFSNIVLGAEWDFDWTSLDATGNGRLRRLLLTSCSAFPQAYVRAEEPWVPQGSFFEQRDSGRSIKTYPRRSVCRRPRSLVDDAAKMKMEPPVNLYGEFARFT